MKKLLLICVVVVGCASNGTGTLGNGQIDIDLGDGRLLAVPQRMRLAYH